MHPRLGRVLRESLACAMSCGAMACVDPAGTFDDFVARDRAGRAGNDVDAGQDEAHADGGFTLPSATQISGRYLSVISSVLSPTKPLVYELEIEAIDTPSGLELHARDRPLSYMDRRTPVADFSASRTIVVPETGSFVDMRLGEVTPGEANAVLNGIETTADITFRAQLDDAELDPSGAFVSFWCGTISGTITAPLMQSLDGSTFTTMRIVGPERYPEPVIDCAKHPAEPLP